MTESTAPMPPSLVCDCGAYTLAQATQAITDNTALAATAQPAAAEAPDARDEVIEQLRKALAAQLGPSGHTRCCPKATPARAVWSCSWRCQQAHAALAAAPVPREGAADA